jgi:pyruvate dehydrogenase E2 component (dihydrolipoamide acetyltransferase)
MATKVHMEALSPTMEEGQVVRWLKSEGDGVSNGEILAEIETDKATMELVARGDGTLRRILLGEGGTAPVGAVIAVIAAADEDIASLVDGAGQDASEAAGAGAGAEATERPRAGPGTAATVAATEAPEPSGPELAKARSEDGASVDGRRIKASPLARRLAEEEGVALEAVQGSGPGGRIVKRDVEQAAKTKDGDLAPAATGGFTHSEADYEDVALSQMRKTIAKRLVESIGPVPHFFLTIDVDMSRAVEARQKVNALLEREGVKISINDIVLKATAVALRRHRDCNAHWGGDHVRRFNRVHIGVAVAIDDGLITPVVRDAHLKGLSQIGPEVRELAARARDKKLKPDEYTGATFSVSNLGMFGIEEFTGVINPPEAGILAVGAVEDRPVIEAGSVVIRPRMKITMSCDHRVIDGAQGSRFLNTLKQILEEPLTALL